VKAAAHVHFTLKSGHWLSRSGCPLCAKCGNFQLLHDTIAVAQALLNCVTVPRREREKGGQHGYFSPVALITGASAGIGTALAREAANDKHDLVLVARRREPMEALAAELKSTGAQITIIPADLSRPDAAATLMETVEQRSLAIDMLINNAGLGDTGRFDQENPEKISSMLQVNIIALTELTRLVLPQMVARKRGKVMLLASTAAFQPGPGMAVYYASKSYVLSFGRAIGHELRGTGVPSRLYVLAQRPANLPRSPIWKAPLCSKDQCQ
jgi:NADP-dependent 3-hydroxy acid dehydrogenase YdfG